MAIARKPKPPKTQHTTPEDKIEDLINKGGSVAASSTSEKETAGTNQQEIRVNLRIPTDLLEQVDKSVKSRLLKTPRHTWLLEAVIEKLEREKKAI